ncbi:MAG: hypothetical protein A2750_00565 [Candidatus Yanofskybacteria bacterium RIFCSPHIGHO2_01_FULL_45_42]|uniref:Uncharacterized protein n=3 Tax=Candidatus Yanofskyibacteriota TaxID=1752733 RepID=A0A1F8F6Q4_9BACT|nr:MAG: hypothetical protein A2750_00565 [Candidatus Yanofskybacteria bacterium RIFCSPHIGHO2_01_FULL_45_42]OGN16385.1 MAG: hypothetical protein A3C81_02925 [Candidatus Yanofskybacteria bacterium RIFCSPHIGHO2_02_FULL_46_19]OGN27058.1 MAG: hypothetical protein A3B17_02415 [Candidatus Yanofskybacteria bacterium RIFCSPLOWO2_01_FULL_45_72]OGN32364.1 MAG: hypothetical protein A3J01_00355 [Candidatus Yanofskybacteria bacterium RIFCSPLOWO2_02_FULL_45_18]
MKNFFEIFHNIGPQYAFIGGEDLRRGILLSVPTLAILLVTGALILIEAIMQKNIVKGGFGRFVLWLCVKIGFAGLIVSIIYLAIGGVKLLISKF